MNLDEVKALIEMLKDTDVTDLQVDSEGLKVRIRREKFLTTIEMPRTHTVAHAPAHAQAAGAAAAPATTAPDAHDDLQRLVTITAPLVGTFYRSPSPDAPSFAENGARVKKGQVICIVEAMKLMNEIESEVDGTLVKCLVENGQPVEYGEPLFLIDPL